MINMPTNFDLLIECLLCLDERAYMCAFTTIAFNHIQHIVIMFR